MRKKLLLMGIFSVIITIPLFVFVIPGCVERNLFNQLEASTATTSDYFELLGEPYKVFEDFNKFEGSEAKYYFPEALELGDSNYYYFWAQEGFPYYWILVVEDRRNKSIVFTKIKK